MSLKLRILTLCGEDVNERTPKRTIRKLLAKHKPKIVEMCHKIGKRECEDMYRFIRFPEIAEELRALEKTLDDFYEHEMLDVVTVLEIILEFRIYI